jgi:hypothetical protein
LPVACSVSIDLRVDVQLLAGSSALDPSPVSRVDSLGFELLARTIRETNPDAIVAPNLVIGGTDAATSTPSPKAFIASVRCASRPTT